jgi:hypothetical protein
VIPATVSYVASTAQFTPKTVETAIEREKLMFRVKARIDRALLVMPITPAEIMVAKVWSMGLVVLVAAAMALLIVVAGVPHTDSGLGGAVPRRYCADAVCHHFAGHPHGHGGTLDAAVRVARGVKLSCRCSFFRAVPPRERACPGSLSN